MPYTKLWENYYCGSLRPDGACAHLDGVRTPQGATAGLRQRIEQRTRLVQKPSARYVVDVSELVVGQASTPLRNWGTRRSYLHCETVQG